MRNVSNVEGIEKNSTREINEICKSVVNRAASDNMYINTHNYDFLQFIFHFASTKMQ